MKKLLLFLMSSCAFAAGTVNVTLAPLTPTAVPVWVLTYAWTGDASTGSVPATAAAALIQQAQLQGYLIYEGEFIPGATTAPTNGYSVTVTNTASVDVLAGAGSTLSSTTSKVSLISPPQILSGTLTLNVSGQSVASATGQVLIYLVPNPYTGTQVTTALVNVTTNPSGVCVPPQPLNFNNGTGTGAGQLSGCACSGGSCTWATIGGGSGSGNMNTSTYDPAAIAQQVVGTTATQTLSNKTLVAPVLGAATATSVSTGTSPPASAWFTGTAGLDGFGTGTCSGTVPAGAGFLCALSTLSGPEWMTSGGSIPVVMGPASATSGHVATFNGTNGSLLQDGGALPTGTVTSIATTGPIGGGTITATGTITCTTCVTSAASLTSGAVVIGSGSQASATTTTGTGVVTAIGNNLSAAGGLTTTIASGTSALGTSSIASTACATVVTTTATNVVSTDSIIWNPNASIKAVTGYVPATTGGLSIAAYPTSGNVNFDVCNWSTGIITPGALTINWRVVR